MSNETEYTYRSPGAIEYIKMMATVGENASQEELRVAMFKYVMKRLVLPPIGDEEMEDPAKAVELMNLFAKIMAPINEAEEAKKN